MTYRFYRTLNGGLNMKKQEYRPEGIVNANDTLYLCGISGLTRAIAEGKILQARCLMCDAEHNLHLKLGSINAIIPREETAIGIKEGTVKDVAIITRVNKMVCFKVMKITQLNGDTVAILSRRKAQEECEQYIYSEFRAGDIIDAIVTHLEQFGAFADIGCGIISMIPIDNISISRIEHPKNRFYAGMEIKAVIKSIDYAQNRINLSHKELLGTWEQNAKLFKPGETVPGIVRSIESYGIFIELTPNLAGLAELTPAIEAGSTVSVYIKSIIPEKMKVKLAIVEVISKAGEPEPIKYMYEGDRIESWRYSPELSSKTVETVFLQTANQT